MATANGNPEWLEYNPQEKDYVLNKYGTYSWGGDMLDTIGYLTRGSGSWNSVGAVPGLTTTEMGGGPVMIQTNPQNSFNLQATLQHLNVGPLVPPANQPMAYLPTAIVDLDFKDLQTSAQASRGSWTAAEQVAAVKAAVQTYGAVYTTMYASAFPPYLDGDGWYHYYYNGTKLVDHAVAIVGWDDSLTFQGAPSPGGYIVQNSWGTTWSGSGQGLFYASYNDANIGKLGATAYQFSPMGRFSGLVLQNQLGPNFSTAPSVGAMGLSWIGNSRGNQEVLSVLTSGDGEIFFESGYDFKVKTLTLGPVANAQYTYLGVAPFTEDNAGSLDLRVDRQDVNSFQTNIGARVAYTWRFPGEGRIIPECRIFWNHEYLQGAGRIRASLDGGSGPNFGYTPTPLSRNRGLQQ